MKEIGSKVFIKKEWRKNKAVLKKRGWSYVRGSIDGNRKQSFQKKKVTAVHLMEIGSKIFRRKQ